MSAPTERIPARMAELGHEPVNDLFGLVRFTCTRCFRAGLNAGGPDYGTALSFPCLSEDDGDA